MTESAQSEKASAFRSLRDWLRGLFGRNDPAKLRENIEELLDPKPAEARDEAAEGARPELGAEERAMLGNILNFGELSVDDVKVPRTDIVSVEAGVSFDDLMNIFIESRKSRIPVYRDTLDDVLGMVHIKDLAPFWAAPKNFSLDSVLRRIPVVPTTMSALALLAEMRKGRQHMAMVVDEYGGVDGLVTIEDLVERIVGDIEDEYDTDETPRIVERDGVIEADGRAAVEEIEKRLGYRLRPDGLGEEIDTVGGLVAALIGRVPAPGEKVESDSGVVFEILDADRRRIKRLVLRGRRRDGEDGA